MQSIYMDHISASPVDQRVVEFAQRYLVEQYGNPSSLHMAGLQAKRVVEEARSKVAGLINAERENTVIFTASATEANNLAVKGVATRNVRKGKRVVTTAVEHMSIINAVKDLQKQGFSTELVPVDEFGTVDLEKLSEAVTAETTITTIMLANNEIGTIQPIREVSRIVHEAGGYLHVDGTMAVGKIPVDVQEMGIDLLTISSNDMYGPQGIGALYIKPGVRIQSIIQGGGQERGIRSGTENLFGIAGMGEAARLCGLEMAGDASRLQPLRDQLIKGVLEVPETHLTGHPENRLPHHASFRFSRVEGESILLNMDMYGVSISTGSACSSKTLEASHVLLAIGLTHEQAHGSMVLSLGRMNTASEVEPVIQATQETMERLRMLSPL